MKLKVGDKVRVLITDFPKNCPVGFETSVTRLVSDGFYVQGNGYDVIKDWYFSDNQEYFFELLT